MPKKMTRQEFDLNMIMRSFSIEIVHGGKTGYTNEDKYSFYITENNSTNVLEIKLSEFFNNVSLKFPNYDSVISSLPIILKKCKEKDFPESFQRFDLTHDDKVDANAAYRLAFTSGSAIQRPSVVFVDDITA